MPLSILSRALVALVLALAVPRVPAAAELPRPAGPVILTVGGHIANTNVDGRADFDLAMLEALPHATVSTSTPWTEGRPVFEGVLMRDLLAAVGAGGTTASAVALNDYEIDLPVADFEGHDVLLAYRIDGALMSVREKGPLWVIYPLDSDPELKSPKTQDKMIWQLRSLEIR